MGGNRREEIERNIEKDNESIHSNASGKSREKKSK